MSLRTRLHMWFAAHAERLREPPTPFGVQSPNDPGPDPNLRILTLPPLLAEREGWVWENPHRRYTDEQHASAEIRLRNVREYNARDYARRYGSRVTQVTISERREPAPTIEMLDGAFF